LNQDAEVTTGRLARVDQTIDLLQSVSANAAMKPITPAKTRKIASGMGRLVRTEGVTLGLSHGANAAEIAGACDNLG
jgi:hypothetical protein